MNISHKDVFHAVTILEVVYLKRAVRRFENLSKDTVKINCLYVCQLACRTQNRLSREDLRLETGT